MPFQFYCPQGHLLEGHESQMGQQSQCPVCGMLFLIPVMPGAAPDPLANLAASPPAAPPPAAPPPPPPEVAPPPAVEPVAAATAAPPAPPEPRVVRIPCPKGHTLETPSDMFGQQALCPYCNTQFELRYEDSLEYKEELAEAKRRREEQINQLWVKWSIRAAIFVGVMFAAMILWLTVLKPMMYPET